MKKLVAAGALFLCGILSGQKANIDSLVRALNAEKPDTSRVNTLNELSWQLKRSRPRTALAYGFDALKLAHSLGFKRGEGEACNNIGNTYDNLSVYDSALVFHNKALALYTSIGYSKGIAGSYNNIGEIYRATGKYAEALESYFLSVDIKKELNDVKGLANSYNNIGSVYNAIGDYAKGLEYQLLSLSMKETLGDPAKIGSSCQNIGQLYHQLGNDSAALRYTDRSIALYTEANDSLSLSRACSNKGTILVSLGKYSEAMQNFSRATLIAQQLGVKRELLMVYNNIVNYYSVRSQFDSALVWSQKALGIGKTLGDSGAIGLIYYNYGEIWHHKGDKAKAISYLKQARVCGLATEDARLIRESCHALAQLCEETGDYRNAMLYEAQYSELQEKEFSDNTAKQLAIQQVKFDTEKKEKEIHVLKQKQVIDRLGISSRDLIIEKRNYFIAGLAATSLLLAFSILLFWSRRKIIIRNREEKAAREAGETERVRIAKDIHDDLGSGLTRIAILSRQNEKENLGTINRISVGLSDNMRDLVWALHPEHATLDQLVSRLREFSGDLSEEIDIRFRRDFPASVPQQKIPKEVLRNTYLVFKEALHNAVKYSGAEEIVIAVTINRAGISIEISDNGKGFDAQAEEGKGNGLANMKHRVHSVNGKISIVSSPGKGARIAFSVPV